MIAIIDYGMGNLRSVQKAFERVMTVGKCDSTGDSVELVVVTNDPAVLRRADKIVLPGVGAFEDAMRELQAHRLIGSIHEAISADKPFLGICLGLQMLFDVSYENGTHRGLGILPGEVVRFERPREFPVPHIGWNQVEQVAPHADSPWNATENPLLNGIEDKAFFYFVHSYYVVPNDAELIAAETDYGGRFCAMIRRGNLHACQFHPEKSQSVGMQLLRNFTQL
ncbi:MAG: imidazole glycerol phosphate synthase subunit HisH [Thermoguttaceae bacterium]|nr:imidazole glycerol phosphate synthase subunit HisH [Thermoguttaceae bacterium]